jgi:hypothetical protein
MKSFNWIAKVLKSLDFNNKLKEKYKPHKIKKIMKLPIIKRIAV